MALRVGDLSGGNVTEGKVLVECWDDDIGGRDFIGSFQVMRRGIMMTLIDNLC